jgi:hypothetical protein
LHEDLGPGPSMCGRSWTTRRRAVNWKLDLREKHSERQTCEAAGKILLFFEANRVQDPVDLFFQFRFSGEVSREIDLQQLTFIGSG